MNTPSERTVFLDAIEVVDPKARQKFLADACGNDSKLRAAVDGLLKAHQQEEHPLDKFPVHEPSRPDRVHDQATIAFGETTSDALLDRTIDSYRLMEQIGEGGFGVVYVAQQEKPVRRKVALKMVKPGMGSKEVIARFEAERQALAMMDHPSIARVFDAGVSDDSRPYFVMELVRGIPITEFCDKVRMSISKRLELFIDVCSAVHHAHQKGVIHRDLKPSNILTTYYDEKPIVKVIDFGIAKAIGQSLTDKTIYTRFMSMMGTPLYMSPEQAEMNTLDVDTRSDIYSLGVLLYELLTGTTPIDRNRMDSADYNEIRRMILEEEPAIPSNRISTLGNRTSTVSGMRQIEPNRFKSAIRGDLDWIVMKAMDKDRTRRYDSAASLARDIQNYLSSEPVEARPPSTLYRVSKFARRNRVTLISAGLIASSLVAGTAISVYQMTNAISALREKDIALHQALIAKGEANAARNEMSNFSERIVQSNVLVSSAQTHANAGRWQAAIDDFAQAVNLQPSFYLPWVQRGQLYSQLHLWNEAASDFAKAIATGAPTDQPQWTGTGALFVLANESNALEILAEQERKRFENAATDFDWQSLRNCIVSMRSFGKKDWAKVAAHAESMIDQRGPIHDDFKGYRDMGRRNGEANRGGDFNRPGPPKGEHDERDNRRGSFRNNPEDRPRPAGRSWPDDKGPGSDGNFRPGGPGIGGPGMGGRASQQPSIPGMRRGGFLPHGAQAYLVALAYHRAGEFQKALDLLDKAELDRGWAGLDLIHNVRALALYESGEIELANQNLERSDQSISRWIEFQMKANEPTSISIPWFDFVEAIVLNQEATQRITGKMKSIPDLLADSKEHAIELISAAQ